MYDSHGSVLEGVFGVYSISLSVLPAGALAGTTTKTTAGGTVTFTGIRILSSGNLQVQATAAGITPATTASMPITNYVYTSTTVASPSPASVNFDLTITVSLFGEDTNPFTGSAAVTLSCPQSFSGTDSLQNSGGTAVFTIYFSQTGGMKITASSSSITSSVTVQVLTSMLKITDYSPVRDM